MRLSALPLLLVSLVASAQPVLEERVTVNYVEVPVTVLGRDNLPVRGLTKANFEVRDNGVVRSIESFETIDFASADAVTALSPLNPASRRNFLLLFDLSYSNPNSIVRAQQAARNFIARSIGGRDLVAVGTVDVDRGFRFLTSFTTDRELLTAAIGDPANFRSTDPLQIAGSSILAPPGGRALGIGERQEVILEQMTDVARQSGRLDEAFSRTRVRRQLEMLGNVARSLQKLSGRKHMMLLSEGFDPRLVEGRSAGESEEQAEENRAVTAGEVWKVDSDKRFGSADTQKSIALMASAFRRADVVLHAVDIQGVRVQNDVRGGAKFNSNEGLFLLANSTGGTVFRNSNDIAAEFDRLSRQHEVVYILGFQAPAGRPGELHELKVRLGGVTGAKVQHRGGYYSAGNESTIERALTLAEVIVNDVPQSELGLSAMAAAFPSGSERAQVPVLLEIDGEDLATGGNGKTATTDIFVYAFDQEGLVRDSLHQRVTLELAQVGERLRSGGIRFYGTLALPAGQYAVKALVRVVEGERRGYQRVELTVPHPGDVALGRPFFFDDAGSWVMVKAGRDNPGNAPYPFILGTEVFIPAVQNTLRKGEPRLFAIFVYNAAADEVTWNIAPEARLVSQLARDNVIKYVFALEDVPVDARELSVVMRRRDSAEERRVSVPIRVE